MSSVLPGLTDINQLTNPLVDPANEIQELIIPAGSEWRVDITDNEKLELKVVSGIAEIFGTELANNVEYQFKNWKFPILAIEDVKLEWKCAEFATKEINIQPNGSLNYIYNLHFAFEKLRGSSFNGFKAMVIGDSCTGKTSLCRTLSSYAIKAKPYHPLYVNLNPQEGIFSIPGCVSATPISDILDVQCPTWGQTITSGATKLHSKQTLLKNFGLEKISQNVELYKDTITQLARGVGKRLEEDSLVCRSGSLIDTPPISSLSEDMSELKHIISVFDVNFIIVLAENDDSKIFIDAQQHLKPLVNNQIFRIPPLDGAVNTEDTYQRALQRNAIKEYFYGPNDTVLSPYAIGVDYEDIRIFKPVNSQEIDPEELISNALEYTPVEISQSNIQHAIVAITYAAKNASGQEAQQADIMGFALVLDVNERKRKVRILLPVSGRIPYKALVLTSFRYLE